MFTNFASTIDLPIDHDLYSALLAAQDLHPPEDSSFNKNLAYTASSNPDVLHHGQMIHDSDHPLFEKDM